LETPTSSVHMDAFLNFEGQESGAGLLENTRIQIDFKKSVLNLSDLGYFMPSLYGMDATTHLEGSLSGTLANLRVSDFVLAYGMNTRLKGDFHLMGLPIIENTFFNLNIGHLQTSLSDLNNLRLPSRNQNDVVTFPETLRNLGRISFNGQVTGFVNDLVAYGNLQTDLGYIRSDLRMMKNQATGLPAYKGQLTTAGFDMGRFFGNGEKLGMITLDAIVEGQGITRETINLKIDGNIGVAEILGYNYENVEILGNITNQKFHGKLLIDDPNVFLDFNSSSNVSVCLSCFNSLDKLLFCLYSTI